MKMPTLAKLLEDQLKDLYSAENQLVKALPKMAKKSSDKSLKGAFASHLEETKHHVERLDQIGQALDIKLSGKKCKAMEGLVEEGSEVLEAEGPGPVIDSALIAAAQRVDPLRDFPLTVRHELWRNIWATPTSSSFSRKPSRKNPRQTKN